ncbi:PorT family protein [Aliifodinibius sp. S!AR15-10]|uniref:porin family protein n=1 Tax=Aliifodinibius sp. S!AR15-10 TaxID=2950437 RepID=UPI00285E2EFE|nr:porin family protein [Aliifodinibius sp. S!AR15-10]MDR8394542.1 PorT family protein [Aliifodinibius sp. S!AR15-10]
MKTMIKTVAALAMCLMIAAASYAQGIKFGVKAGADFSNWGGDDVENLNLDMNYGYHFGGFAEIPLTRVINLESGLYLSRKGFRTKEEILGVKMDLNNTSSYLDLPVLAKYAVTRNYSLMFGPQFSYLLDNKLTLKAAGEKESDNSVQGFNRFDLGLVAGMGYQFENGLLLSTNYDFGLTTLDDETNMKVFNRVLKASVGYRF